MSTNTPSELGRSARSRAWFTLFVSNLAIVTVEVLAPRLLMPYTGAPWASSTITIALVLLCMGLGSAVGGIFGESRHWTPYALGVSGACIGLSGTMIDMVGGWITGSMLRGAVVLVLTVGPAVLLLASLTPVLATALVVGREPGRTFGLLGALSSVAGVSGAVLSLFMPLYLPARHVLLALAVLVLALLLLHKRSVRVLAVVLAIVVLASSLNGAVAKRCNVPSRLHCLQMVESGSGRYLLVDKMVNSGYGRGGISDAVIPYITWMLQITDAHLKDAPAPNVVQIGVGAGTLPAALQEQVPQANQYLLENDPDIAALSRDRLGLGDLPSVRFKVADGRFGLRELPDRWADVVVLDAYSGAYIPEHLTTVEFAAEVERVLRADGLLVVNVVEAGSDLEFTAALLASFERSFPHAALWRGAGAQMQPRQNMVLVFSAVSPVRDVTLPGTTRLDDAQLRTLRDAGFVLTDRFAPVERLAGLLFQL